MAPHSRNRATPALRKLPSSKAVPLAEIRAIWPQVDQLCSQYAADGWTLPKSLTVYPGVKIWRFALRVSQPLAAPENGRHVRTCSWSLPKPPGLKF